MPGKETFNKVEPTSKEKIESPIPASSEINPEVEKKMTDKTKETAETLTPESRRFLGGLYEKIKSSDIVKNIVDRHEVHKNNKLENRANAKIGELERKKAMEIKGVQDIKNAQKESQGSSKKIEEIYKSMGKEMEQAEKDKFKSEIETHQKLIDEREGGAQRIECKITDATDKLEDYKNKAEAARGHLAGRLTAKMETNNQALQEFDGQRSEINKNINDNQTQIKELDKYEAGFKNLLSEGVQGAAAEIAKKNLAEIKAKKAEHIKNVKNLESNQNKIDKKIDGLKEKNNKLQEQHDKIYPAKEKTTQKQAGEKPENYKIDQGKVTLNFGGGKEMFLDSKGNITTIGSDGAQSTLALDKITNEALAKFKAVSSEELESVGIPPEIIERIQNIKPEAGEKKKFIAGNLVAEWNKYVKIFKLSELQVSLDKNSDPGQEFGDKTLAKEFLLNLIAKKAKVSKDKLKSPITSKVINFFNKQTA